MIDNKKIEEAALGYCAKCSDITNRNVDLDEDECVDLYNGFIDSAKWAINELLKGLFHPASEVPRNDNGKVLAFSKEFGNRKLYDMNDELDKTTCDTYQQMWEEQVNIFKLSDWIFVDELFDLITKGGEHD